MPRIPHRIKNQIRSGEAAIRGASKSIRDTLGPGTSDSGPQLEDDATSGVGIVDEAARCSITAIRGRAIEIPGEIEKDRLAAKSPVRSTRKGVENILRPGSAPERRRRQLKHAVIP
jgi:hypothetical protein